MKLILTEKPSVAVDIAKSLGRFDRKDGYLEAGDYTVTWAFGHLFEIDDSIASERWELSTLPVFPEEFRYKCTNGEQFGKIRELLMSADEVIISTDAGREGELIARLILIHAGWDRWDRTYRLWTSEALTPEVVKREIRRVKPAEEYDSLYWSALARQHADFVVGINFTRLVSLKSADKSVWSVGRVQTPTLKLIVDRDLEIENFKPQPYVIVRATFKKGKSKYEGRLLVRESDEGFRLSPEQARRIIEELEGEREGVVASVKKIKHTDPPPLLHSLTSLQREANKAHGFSAKRTLEIAQRLYEKRKIISYPRTEARYLATSSKELVKRILIKLGREDLVPAVFKVGKRVFDDSRLTDHHAIIPLAPAPEDLGSDEKKIYHLIHRRFIGAFMEPYIYESTVVITELGNYRFLSKGKVDLQLGWKSLYREEEKVKPLPPLQEGDVVEKIKLIGEDKMTEPPSRYTDNTLLKEMERLMLGTPATRSEIISTLIERAYVRREGRSLISTAKGRELIKNLSSSSVSSPEMTSEWEKKLDLIYREKLGERGYRNFMEEIKEFVEKSVRKLLSINLTHRSATAKMLKLASSLAKETGLLLPEGDEFEEIKDFIDRALKEKERQLAEGIDKCKCGGKIIPFRKGWKCETCGAVVWEKLLGKKISRNLAVKLLKGERVLVKGLKSKNGRRYSAYMHIEEGKIRLDGDVNFPRKVK